MPSKPTVSQPSMDCRGETDINVVIIGAGIASLVAARELLSTTDSVKSVTIVEACDYVGGRIKSNDDLIPGGHRIDLGAEIIHGSGTMLTDIVDAKRLDWQKLLGNDEQLLEEVFIAAHADGGPQEQPTSDSGKYGIYYLAEEDRFLRYDTDDIDFRRMSEALHNLECSATVEVREGETGADGEEMCTGRCHQSLGAHLDATGALPQRMTGLLEASFGNTAACTDLHKISLSTLCDFERHWEENEEEGDVRLHSRIGMVGVVDALREKLERDERLSILLNWKVGEIKWEEFGGVSVISAEDKGTIRADKVLVTASPPVVLSGAIQFQPPLPSWKLEAYNMVGMERAVKVVVKFRERFWPKEVQSIITSKQPIPEIWFREIGTAELEDCANEFAHLAVGFLTSQAAENFLISLGSSDDKYESLTPERRKAEAAADKLKDQLALIFRDTCSREDLEDSYASAIMYDWGEVDTILGGYIYPKVGCKPKHFSDMARNIGPLHFAGEATNTGACCTVQAAMETGARAATEILRRK